MDSEDLGPDSESEEPNVISEDELEEEHTQDVIDTDGDGLNDIDEGLYGTDINIIDTDGDGYSDGDEVKNGYNPNGSGKL